MLISQGFVLKSMKRLMTSIFGCVSVKNISVISSQIIFCCFFSYNNFSFLFSLPNFDSVIYASRYHPEACVSGRALWRQKQDNLQEVTSAASRWLAV